MKIAYNVEYLVIFSMPTSALGLPGHTKHWHGQSGHLPIKNYEGMGKAGIAKKGGRAGKSGHGHALAHHYYVLYLTRRWLSKMLKNAGLNSRSGKTWGLYRLKKNITSQMANIKYHIFTIKA